MVFFKPPAVNHSRDGGLWLPSYRLWHYRVVYPVEDVPTILEDVFYEAILLYFVDDSLLPKGYAFIGSKIETLRPIYLMDCPPGVGSHGTRLAEIVRSMGEDLGELSLVGPWPPVVPVTRMRLD